MKDISERILELREANGLNRVEMAEKLGVNKSSITRYENGDMRPTLDVMINIHNIFGVSLDWLAGIETGEQIKYNALVQECLDSGITSDRLKQAIDLLKGC
jgi:transcriptional regulator with XRE-family HTH domain